MAQKKIATDLRELASWKEDALISAIKARLALKFGPLPDEGIIAGQAVASACYEVVGVGVGPMRDLDLFVDQKEFEGAVEFRSIRVVQNKMDFFLTQCSFSDALNFNAVNKGGYSVHFSTCLATAPDINIIGCSTGCKNNPLCAKTAPKEELAGVLDQKWTEILGEHPASVRFLNHVCWDKYCAAEDESIPF